MRKVYPVLAFFTVMAAAFLGGYLGKSTYSEVTLSEVTWVLLTSLPATVAGVLMIIAVTMLYHEKNVPSRLYWMAVTMVSLATLSFGWLCLMVARGV